MIHCDVTLECDSCGRKTQLKIQKAFGPVDLFAIMHSFGWREFLRGPVLCPECADNEDKATRAAEITRSFVFSRKGPIVKRTDAEVVAALQRHGTSQRAGDALGISATNVRMRMRRIRLRNGEHGKESSNGHGD